MNVGVRIIIIIVANIDPRIVNKDASWPFPSRTN